MSAGGNPHGSRLGAIRVVVVESPDLAAPLVGALDAADVGAWVWVEAENCLYWSPLIPALLGIDPRDPDLLGTFLAMVHPDDRAGVAALIGRSLTEEAFCLRFRFRDRDATDRWLEMRGRIERDAAGALVRQGGTIRDVSQELAQEQERAEANARLEALISAMPFGVWLRSGDDLRVSHQNPIALRRWGDLRGTRLADIPLEVASAWKPHLQEALAGNVVKKRRQYTFADGARTVDDILAPVRIGGETTGVVGIQIDVTGEQRSREFEALMTQIASDFVSLSTDSLAGALAQELERLARFVGASVATLCEVTHGHQVAITHWWIDPATGRDRPVAMEFGTSDMPALHARLEANDPVVIGRRADLPADGAEARWLDARGLLSVAIVPARRDEDTLIVLGLGRSAGNRADWPADTIPVMRLAGAILSGVVVRLRAETRQRNLERRMQDAQKLESLGVLAGGIAHDFNNLLTAILGNANLLRTELSAHPELAGPLEEIEVASLRAADLCRQMLAYAGRGRFALQSLEINEAVRASESLLRVSVPKKALLQFELAPGLSPVLADHAQLRQVLVNLVHNAAEAIGEAEGTITVSTSEITCTAQELSSTVFSPQLDEGRYVRLMVSDDGIGMTPETAARIFDPFFTTKFTGRGLGLAAVIGIVRAHTGALRVESAPGAGSRFELLLPAQPRAAEEAREGPQLPDAETMAVWRTTGIALVVDDEPGVRELVKSIAGRAGMQVVVAEDGRAAVETFRTMADEVRLVVLDLTMPGLDGRETLAAMRRIRPDLKAILMSGYTRVQSADAPAHLFLQKPFTPLALRQAIWKVLGGR